MKFSSNMCSSSLKLAQGVLPSLARHGCSLQMNTKNTCFIKSLQIVACLAKGKILCPFDESVLLYCGVFRNAKEKREIFKSSGFEHFCCHNNEMQLLISYRSLNVFKKFSCRNNSMHLYFQQLVLLLFSLYL